MLLRLCLMLVAGGLGWVVAARAEVAAGETTSRISGPITHENIAIYFVHGTSVPGPIPSTLQEALARGDVEVFETGNVRELQIENKGKEAVFVQFGDLVKGGQQDRVLTVSMLLPPRSGRVPIGAYCVEQGRWSARGMEDAKTFSRSEAMMPSREAKIAIIKRAKPAQPPAGAMLDDPEQSAAVMSRHRQRLEQLARPEQRRIGPSDGQSEVWRSVAQVQSALSASLAAPVASQASRSSLQLSLENAKLQEAMAAYVAAIEPAGLAEDDIVGVVVAVNGRISSADVYPSNGLFKKMWPKLVRAGATEALAAKIADPSPTPDQAAVGAFLAQAESGEVSARQLGVLARLETVDADKALRTEARTAGGTLLHRSYIAK